MRTPLLRAPALTAVALLVGLLLVPTPIHAQLSTGAMQGTVTDGTAPLPGATITVTNPATGYTRTATTSTDGTFYFPGLQVGTFTVKVELAGFATVTVEKVEVRIATMRSLDVTMRQAKGVLLLSRHWNRLLAAGQEEKGV